jgi:hypothetical protein
MRSLGRMQLSRQRLAGITAGFLMMAGLAGVGVASNSVPNAAGYWAVGSDGGVFAFGDAGFYGSAGDIPLQQPVVGMATTPTGAGYWLVASDGGVFAFGDAAFYGSIGGHDINRPVVGIAGS